MLGEHALGEILAIGGEARNAGVVEAAPLTRADVRQ